MAYEDELMVAFHDNNPQAPVHLLLIPEQHISSVNELAPDHMPLLGHLFYTASQLAKEFAIDDHGYRLVMNCNSHGGQSVYHIHLHLLGGRQMQWPPG